MKHTVSISFTANAPTTFKLKVEVDDETGECEVLTVEHSPVNSPKLSPQMLCETLSSEELAELDAKALKAAGVSVDDD